MYHPLGSRILIKPVVQEEKSAGGIILDRGTADKDSVELAEVIELGPLAYKDLGDDIPWVKIGDVVLIQRYAGKKIEDQGIVYRILKDVDVIAKKD